MNPADEDAVDEDPAERRDEQPGNDQREPGQDPVEQGGPRPCSRAARLRNRLGNSAAGVELLSGFEGQDDSGEGPVELLLADRPRSAGRVVEMDPSLENPSTTTKWLNSQKTITGIVRVFSFVGLLAETPSP